jgi:uncharacterized protein YcbX
MVRLLTYSSATLPPMRESVGPSVRSLTYTPVKGTALVRPAEVEVQRDGIVDDRLFHVVDAVTRRQLTTSPRLLPIRSAYRPDTRHLVVELPDGRRAEGEVRLGDPLVARIPWDGDRPLESREVLGAWSELLSGHLGRDVVLAQAMPSSRAVDVEPLTLVSHASIARAEQELAGRHLGARRFRMNLNIDGVAAHEEDEWYGRRLAIGDAVLLITGPVPRCAVTTFNPDSGHRDASTLKAIVAYRPPIPDPAGGGGVVKAPFGVYARVERAGRIAVGAALTLL